MLFKANQCFYIRIKENNHYIQKSKIRDRFYDSGYSNYHELGRPKVSWPPTRLRSGLIQYMLYAPPPFHVTVTAIYKTQFDQFIYLIKYKDQQPGIFID